MQCLHLFIEMAESPTSARPLSFCKHWQGDAAMPATPADPASSRSVSQQIQDLQDEEWPDEAEEQLRKIELSLLGGQAPASAAVHEHPLGPFDGGDPSPEPSESKGWSSTQEMEALLDLPWSTQDEAVVRAIEQRERVSGPIAPPSPAAPRSRCLSQSVTPSDALLVSPRQGSHDSGRQNARETSSPAPAQSVLVRCLLFVRVHAPLIAENQSSSPAVRTSAVRRRARLRQSVVGAFLDLEAEESGTETCSGSPSGKEGGGGELEGFIERSSQASFQSDTAHTHWRGLLSQNSPNGPQFHAPPVRRGGTFFGGPSVLGARPRISPSVSPSPTGTTRGLDEYEIGSFVLDDDEPIT